MHAPKRSLLEIRAFSRYKSTQKWAFSNSETLLVAAQEMSFAKDSSIFLPLEVVIYFDSVSRS